MGSRREDLGSWLEGTPGDRQAGAVSRLGLPSDGSGSLAPLWRRLAGVGVDWALSLAVSAAFFPAGDEPLLPLLAGDPMATLAVFGVSTLVLVSLLGHTVGQRIAGLLVVRLRDVVGKPQDVSVVRPPGLVAGFVRTALLCMVVPAVVWDGAGRGMHDVAAGTVIVRR
ncbi:RDD family protein [Cellulomonas sp. KRMCY2]|uniref:RDD family protein n=1 Tax=Cellulomonas sp. KRMCY2 TaxID=1304865 RepID=UPI00045E7273|nr:RDD family protein [Cellulomonas sp. KRMCY2]